MSKPTVIWIIGRRVTIATNGHVYVAEPFLAFETEAQADAACDIVEAASGDRPMRATAVMMVVQSPSSLGKEG